VRGGERGRRRQGKGTKSGSKLAFAIANIGSQVGPETFRMVVTGAGGKVIDGPWVGSAWL